MSKDLKVHTKEELQAMLQLAIKNSTFKENSQSSSLNKNSTTNEDNLYSESQIFTFAKELGLSEEGFKLALKEFSRIRKYQTAIKVIKQNMTMFNSKMFFAICMCVMVSTFTVSYVPFIYRKTYALFLILSLVLVCSFLFQYLSKNQLKLLAKKYVCIYERDGVEI